MLRFRHDSVSGKIWDTYPDWRGEISNPMLKDFKNKVCVNRQLAQEALGSNPKITGSREELAGQSAIWLEMEE